MVAFELLNLPNNREYIRNNHGPLTI